MTVLKSLLSTFRKNRRPQRKSRGEDFSSSVSAEALEDRVLLVVDPFESNPNAPITIYLDFDGHVEGSNAWANRAIGSRPVNTPVFSLDGNLSVDFTSRERETIQEVYLRVAEDFSPFDNVNVTTIEPTTFNRGETIRVSVGGTGGLGLWSGGDDRWSARAYNNAIRSGFTDATLSNTVFVFARDYPSHPRTHPLNFNRPSGEVGRDVAFGVSEAVGIAMGMDEPTRLSTIQLAPLVNDVENNFPRGWRDTWSDQGGQDDLSILTSAPNNLTFVADDHGDSTILATTIPVTDSTISGFIESPGDVDYFHFSTTGGTTSISVQAELDLLSMRAVTGRQFTVNDITNPGANLNPDLLLLDANFNPFPSGATPVRGPGTDVLGTTITEVLPAGNYYVAVSDAGEYGNLGRFDLSLSGIGQPFEEPVPFAARDDEFPGGEVTIYLDFNGSAINENSIFDDRGDQISQAIYIPAFDLDGDRTSFAQVEIDAINEIRERVAEDFAPFNINVTTQPTFSFPTEEAFSIVIGGDGSWLDTSNTLFNATGTGYIDWLTDYSPGLDLLDPTTAPFANPLVENVGVAFPELLADNKEIAHAASSLILNSLGVEPAVTYDINGNPVSLISDYPAFGPLGGDTLGSFRDLIQPPDDQTRPGGVQDPFSIITSGRNLVEYRSDDHAGDPDFATNLDLNAAVSVDGILGRVFNAAQIAENDVDQFRFLARESTNVLINVDTLDLTGLFPGVTNPGANFDPVVRLYRLENNILFLVDEAGVRAPGQSDTSIAQLDAQIFVPLLPVGEYIIEVSGNYIDDFSGSPILSNDPALNGNYGQYTLNMTGALPPSVEITLNENAVREDAGTLTAFGRISRPPRTPDTLAIDVTLASSDPTEVSLPVTSLTIPPGVSFVDFDVVMVDDDLLDGDQNVGIDVIVGGEVNGTAFMTSLDVETIAVSLPGNSVDEPFGDLPETIQVTVSRSNIDTGPDDHWVSFSDQLQRFDSNGNLVESITIPAVNPPRPNFEVVHDVHALDDGRVAVFNGTDDAFLSVYNPNSTDPNPANRWTITELTDSVDRVNASGSDLSAGGITSFENYIFVSDLNSGDGIKGILRFDANNLTADPERFAERSVGNRLFVADNTQVQEINSLTGEILNDIPLPNNAVESVSVASVAYDGENLWVLAEVSRFSFFGFFFTDTVGRLYKINPDTEEILETHLLPEINTFNELNGMTFMNDQLWFNRSINSTSFFADFEIISYDPVTRQFSNSVLPVSSANGLFLEQSLGAIQDEDDPDASRLLVIGYPNFFFSTLNDARVYEIDPSTGLATSSFPLRNGFASFFQNRSVTAAKNVEIGNFVYDELIYVNGELSGIEVYSRNGTLIDIDPTTALLDVVPNTGYPANQDIGGGNVPGLTTRNQDFRDVTVGLADGIFYGLYLNGRGFSTYNPVTLAQLAVVDFDANVNTLSVDDEGRIWGGADGGVIHLFDENGVTLATYNTGLSDLVDIETNVSKSVILSDVNGQIATGSIDDMISGSLTMLENTGALSYTSFQRSPSTPSGDLFVTLTSSDITEISIPIVSTQVVIPEGQQSVTVDILVEPDTLLDGPQPATVAGTADLYFSQSPTIVVNDSEQVAVDPLLDLNPITGLYEVSENDLPFRQAIRIHRTDTGGPFTVPTTAGGAASEQQPQQTLPVYPVSIGDNGVTTSNITFPTQRTTISDLNVTVNLEHENLSELTVTLVSPSNTRVELFSNLALDGTLLSNTIFDDESVRSLQLGTAPYSQQYKSAEVLSTFDLENPSGTWTLEVTDSAGENTGTLLDWSLDITTPSAPQTIVDRGVTLSEIVIPKQNSIITDVNVTIDLQHSFIPDMDVFLVSPSGTRVELFTDLGSNETLMTDTTFDDESPDRIVDGSAPFTAAYVPEELLSKLDGENPTGPWTLEVTDDNVNDAGRLFDWSLDIETLGLAPASALVTSVDPSEILLSHGSQINQPSLTVNFPAGVSEVFVDLIPQDDQIVDATQQAPVSISNVTIGGFIDGVTIINVHDYETLTVSVDNTVISEGDGNNAATGTIFRSDTALTAPLVVTLTSTDTTELTVPATITIPAGQSSLTFPIAAVDDADLDGDITGIQIVATAFGYEDGTSVDLTVTDEEPRLGLSTVSATVGENDGTMAITVSRLDAANLTVAQQVSLSSSDPSILSVPATFLIPINALSATFTATIHPDDVVDGIQQVTVTAVDADLTNPAVSGDTLDITIEDAEEVQITVDGNNRVLENAGAITGTVTLTAIVPDQETVVTLTNSDLTELSIPASVTVLPNETTATFVIQAVDDAVIDRDQLVTLAGSAPGYLDGSVVITVQDHEPAITLGPASVTEDVTPQILWAPVDQATRYDLWLNDVSRDITQLYRIENIDAVDPIAQQDFPDQTFPSGWTTSGAEIDDLGLGEPSGQYSLHLNGDPNGGDHVISPTYDLSPEASVWDDVEAVTGVQLKYSFQQTGSGESPEASEDLVVSYRNASGEWIVVKRHQGAGPDMTVFEDSVVYLPEEALHSNFAIRFDAIGKSSQPDENGDPVIGAYDDWFIDDFELAAFQQFTPPQEFGVGKYRWWVQAYDDLEQPGFWSPGHDFQVRTRPEFLNPTNGNSAQSAAPVLSWTTIVDTNYDLWVNDLTRGVSQVIREKNLDTTSYATALANLQGGTYKAWVQGVAPDGFTGFWSQPVTFTILSAPTGLRPSGSTFDRTPELGWNAQTGADRYYLWINKQNSGQQADIIFRDRFIEGESFVLPNDLDDGNYVFWVKAISADGSESDWSAPSRFTIGGRPEIITPTADAVVNTPIQFTWTGITGTARYEFWLNRIDVHVNRAVYEPSLTGTTLRVDSLPAGSYRLWVRAISEMGENSAWSVPTDITVLAANETGTPSEVMTTRVTVASEALATRQLVVSPLEELEPMQRPQATVATAAVPVETPVAVAVEAELDAVDDIMADWDVADVALDTQELEEEESNAAAAAFVGLGLVGGRLNRRRNRKKRSEK